MSEKGSVLILVLIFLNIFFITTGCLMLVINYEVQIVDYYVNKIQADYMAEIALNKAIKEIRINEEKISSEKLEKINGSLDSNNDYYIKKAEKLINSDEIIYILSAVGKSFDIKSELKLEIKKGRKERE